MSGTVFLILGGLAALGFLVLLWQHRKMPLILRAILSIAAAVIVIYVVWTMVTLYTTGPALPK
jgi:DMSO reductase anchor subunit